MIRNELLSMLADDRITIPTDRLLELLGDMNFFADCPPPELIALTDSDDDTMRQLLAAMWSAGYRDAMKAVMTLIPRTEPKSQTEVMAKLNDAITSWEKHPKYGDVPRGDVIQAADELASLATEMLAKLKAPTGE